MNAIKITKRDLKELLEEQGLKIDKITLSPTLHSIRVENKRIIEEFNNQFGTPLSNTSFIIEGWDIILFNKVYVKLIIEAMANEIKKTEKRREEILKGGKNVDNN